MRKEIDMFEVRLLEKGKRAKRREADADHKRANGSRPKNAYKRHGRDHARYDVVTPDPGHVIRMWARSLPATSYRTLCWENLPIEVQEAVPVFAAPASKEEDFIAVLKVVVGLYGSLT